MFIKANTLDDLMQKVLDRLIKTKSLVVATKGSSKELSGVLLQLTNPSARLSRTETKGTLFSCLGEFLWYMAGTNDLHFINYYIPGYEKFSDDGKTLYGAYGPRLLNMHAKHNQIDNVINLLKRKQSSRQAVIQLFDSSDIIGDHSDIPCTCFLQFMVRKSRLHMFTSMRSNDAFIGLPHDIFAFTMLQELIARTLGVELGSYKHAVGSLHLYENKMDRAEMFLKEGWQTSESIMPAMPKGDPWQSIKLLLKAEAGIRNGDDIELHALGLDDYWADMVCLLKIFGLSKENGNESKISVIEAGMSSETYNSYIEKRRNRKAVVGAPEQLGLLTTIK